MAFVPFSKRHAIAEVVFALQITPEITYDIRAALKKGHPKWQAFLPKFIDFQIAFEAGFGTLPGDRPPPSLPPPPLQFARHGADGAVEWRLFISEGDIVVNCLTFVGWQEAWRRARDLFTKVSKILPNETAISSASLQYTNMFSWDEAVESYDVRKLLNEDSPRVPAAILECGPYWHLHQGWFSQADGLPEVARVLDRMNMDAVDDPTKGHVVKFESLYRLNFIADASPRLRKAFAVESGAIDSCFDDLHTRAKESLSDYLAADLRGRLNLHAP